MWGTGGGLLQGSSRHGGCGTGLARDDEGWRGGCGRPSQSRRKSGMGLAAIAMRRVLHTHGAYGRTGYWFSHPVAGVPHDMTDAQLEPVELLVDDAQADDETEQGRFVLSRSAARFAACWAFSASSRAVWNDSAKNSYTQRNTRTECGCQKK